MCETRCCALLQHHPPNEQFITLPSLPIWPPKQQSPTAFYSWDVQDEDEITELLLTPDRWVLGFSCSEVAVGSRALNPREEQPNPSGAHCWEEALWDQCVWLPSMGLLGWCLMSSGLPNGHLQIVFRVLLAICYCHSTFPVIAPVKQRPFPYLSSKTTPKQCIQKKCITLDLGFRYPDPERNASVSFLCTSTKSCPQRNKSESGQKQKDKSISRYAVFTHNFLL